MQRAAVSFIAFSICIGASVIYQAAIPLVGYIFLVGNILSNMHIIVYIGIIATASTLPACRRFVAII